MKITYLITCFNFKVKATLSIFNLSVIVEYILNNYPIWGKNVRHCIQRYFIHNAVSLKQFKIY